ncbi:AzlC family ABC transporter permease [Oceanomicrobium pacificus]|uniref:Branched-chain amino acid ABC transporter permease n=1 Tax=Oceanomicrobium pacificus TaxID=2692916 RepID=A0A6B0TQE7_9RHOB|nr:AzlC family ABC transporter permease [Oceanomicrobium pacificus]MXU64015.1 branched-chain amino acid ABC transporter permease [Oceanomicrobium pacificus]
MSQVTRSYWQGVRTALPFLLVMGPFALLFGVLATEAGLTRVETTAFSVIVIAGAAQFVALQLLTESAPLAAVILTGLAVNLRMLFYSAALVPHLGDAPLWKRALAGYLLFDQTYGMAIQRFETLTGMTGTQKYAYFYGCATPLVIFWYGFTVVGAVAGNLIPEGYPLDFAVPITFIALFAPALRSLPHLGAAFVSVVATLALGWVPYNLGLIIAALIAMASGAALELWLTRRAEGGSDAA